MNKNEIKKSTLVKRATVLESYVEGWIIANNYLPPLNKYVIIFLNKGNWHDSDDPVNVYVKVAKRVRAQVEGNNLVPFQYNTFGASKYFGQEVFKWKFIEPF